MAEKSLKIDDDYCEEVASFANKQGTQLEKYLNSYLKIMKDVRKDAIKDGDVAKALDCYITYAEKLKNQISNASTTTSKQISKFIIAIDEADKYLY